MVPQHVQAPSFPFPLSLLPYTCQAAELEQEGSGASGLHATCEQWVSTGAVYLACSSRALDDAVSWKRDLLCWKNGSYFSVPGAG